MKLKGWDRCGPGTKYLPSIFYVCFSHTIEKESWIKAEVGAFVKQEYNRIIQELE